MKRFLLLLLALSSLTSLKATHIIGGEISWETTTNNQYIFTLVLYRDCNGIAMPANAQVINYPGGSISLPRISLSNVDPFMGNTCTAFSPCFVQKGVFRSAPVSLNGTPPATGWEFSWSSCCRNQYQNSGAQGYYINATMFPYTPPGAANPVDYSTFQNNSPILSNDRILAVCDGLVEHNPWLIETDLDSVIVSFGDLYTAAGTPLVYNAGYSVNAPLPDSTENPLNGPVTIDSQSGLVSFETYGATPGWYIIGLEAHEYREGQLISTIRRDLPFYFQSSATCNANNRPNVYIDTLTYPFIHRSKNTYRLTALNNDTINFQILVNDTDVNPNGSAQTHCMNVSGIKINSDNPQNANSCAAGGPCATLTPLTTNSYCGSGFRVYEFNWVAQCSSLSFGVKSRSSYRFNLAAIDDACPFAKIGNITVLIDLYPSQSNSPNLRISGGNTSGNVNLDWDQSEIQSSSPFQQYVVYANNGPGTPFSVVDSISDRSITSSSLNGLSFPAEVYMTQITGSCSLPSEPSDTLSTAFLAFYDRTYFPYAVYPQPAKDRLTIEQSEGTEPIESVVIYDLKGAELRRYDLGENQIQHELRLDVPDGVYLLELKAGENQFRKRIVISE